MKERDSMYPFLTILYELINPFMKSLGFVQRGQDYYRDLSKTGQCFRIQSSPWSTKAQKFFMFHMGLIHKEIDREIFHSPLGDFATIDRCIIQTKTCHLNFYQDIWYKITSETDQQILQTHIENDLLDNVHPFFRRYEDQNNWLDFTNHNSPYMLDPVSQIHLLFKLNRNREAQVLLEKHYRESHIPKNSRSTKILFGGIRIEEVSGEKLDYQIINQLEQLAISYGIELSKTN
ncbi:DUF4304 domain-containing protein [Sphingobacterium sp. LRF_L2]|uniref:DUF4304 domain-containing protein n=1 Tax=Sphingobacterium sp. LRF_L2 TaxID=3369421 RepID=UPI003F5E94B5